MDMFNDRPLTANSNGLGVLLQFMTSAKEQGDWVALRAVVDLSVTTTAERYSRPLLKLASTCDGLGRRRPILAAVADLDCSRACTPAATSSAAAATSRSSASAGRYPLVKALVEQCVTEGQNLIALGKVARALTPPEGEAEEDDDSGAAPYPALQKALQSASPHRVPLLAALVQTVPHAPHSTELSDESDERDDSSAAQSLSVPRNISFVFIKPHACLPAVQQLVEKRFQEANMRIERQGVVTSEEINERGLIDLHYAAIARYATKWAASDISLSVEMASSFQKNFGVSWQSVVQGGKVLNATQAAQWYSCRNGDALAAKWNQLSTRTKLGPGLYVGYDSKDDLYVVNGFYLRNREKFTAPGGKIQWYVVSWEEQGLPWKAFRSSFIGSTDPTTATQGSLRADVLQKWKELGLSAEPNVSDNGVHASAGPMEGLAERLIWLQMAGESHDPFGRQLSRAGVTTALVRQLLQNPDVTLQLGGKPTTGLTFDLLEDRDSSEVVQMLVQLQASREEEFTKRIEQKLPVATPLSVLMTGTASAATPLLALNALSQHVSVKDATPSSAKKSNAKEFRPQPPAVPPAAQTTGASSSLRPRQTSDGRVLTSPYTYTARSNGAGLGTVFRHAISTGAAPLLVGLGLLHGAVLQLKKENTVVETYGRVLVEDWPTTFSPSKTLHGSWKGLSVSRPLAAAPAAAPPMVPVTATTAAASIGNDDAVKSVFTTSSPRTPRRLTTADRIRRRTQKLQAEVEGIERRREERAAALLQHATPAGYGSATTPRKPTTKQSGPSPRLTKLHGGVSDGATGSSPSAGVGFQVRGDRLSPRPPAAPTDDHPPPSVPDIKGELLRATSLASNKSPVLTTLAHRGPTTSGIAK